MLPARLEEGRAVALEGAARGRRRRDWLDVEELFKLHLFYHYYPGPRKEEKEG